MISWLRLFWTSCQILFVYLKESCSTMWIRRIGMWWRWLWQTMECPDEVDARSSSCLSSTTMWTRRSTRRWPLPPPSICQSVHSSAYSMPGILTATMLSLRLIHWVSFLLWHFKSTIGIKFNLLSDNASILATLTLLPNGVLILQQSLTAFENSFNFTVLLTDDGKSCNETGKINESFI